VTKSELLTHTGDVLEWFASAAISSAPTEILKAYVKRRLDLARETLLEEVSQGEVPLVSAALDDDRVWFHWLYARAAIEGAARENLRLLARLMISLPAAPDLISSRFHLYAKLISTLTRDELLVLAAFIRFEQRLTERPIAGVWRLDEVEKILVPGAVASASYFAALVHSLAGSGLLIPPQRGQDGLGDHMPSEIAVEIERLSRLSELIVPRTDT
jgi:hypothetical protein